MKNLKFFMFVIFLEGICLPSYGFISKIKPSTSEVQAITQGNEQQFIDRLETSLDTEFNLKYGQIAHLQTENIEIKFSKVIDDSRCPSDVTCIWQGQVIIRLDITKNGKKLSRLKLTLIPGRDASTIQFLKKYTVVLKEVLPYPKSGQDIVTEDYIAKLIVTKELPKNQIPNE